MCIRDRYVDKRKDRTFTTASEGCNFNIESFDDIAMKYWHEFYKGEGDTIAIRHKMYLSLSYDHRVVDGMLGGNFLHFIADYLENWKG